MTKRLYERIYLDLKQKIFSRALKDGDMLPPENGLEKIYGVSRAPVRQALSMLERDRLILRMPGRGTFISFKNREEEERWFRSSPFSRQFERDWERITCQTFSVTEEHASPEAMCFFNLRESDRVIHIYRIRRVEDTPVVLSHHYLPDVSNIDKVRAEGNFFSIRNLIKKIYGYEPTEIHENLKAVSAMGATAEKMELQEGHPLILTVRRSYNDEKPIQLDSFYTNTDLWNYSTSIQKQ